MKHVIYIYIYIFNERPLKVNSGTEIIVNINYSAMLMLAKDSG